MSRCKILIIDDDQDDVAILSEAFSQAGVDGVHYVFTAMQAFMYLEEVEKDCLPKLIVTDHYLPGMTGAEFLKDLKGMEKYSHIHVIVLSTHKTAKEIERYKVMGAIDYIKKPVTYDEYFDVAAEIRRKAIEIKAIDLKEIRLLFPDSSQLTEFVLKENIKDLETNSSEFSLKGLMTSSQIQTATEIYGAIVHPIYL